MTTDGGGANNANMRSRPQRLPLDSGKGKSRRLQQGMPGRGMDNTDISPEYELSLFVVHSPGAS